MVQQHQTLKWPTLRVALSPATVFECWSPSCPALCHLVLGVVAGAVHLAEEKKCTGSPALYFFCACACYNCHLKLAQSHAYYCCRSSTAVVCQGIFTCSRLRACMKPLTLIQATFLCLQAYGLPHLPIHQDIYLLIVSIHH